MIKKIVAFLILVALISPAVKAAAIPADPKTPGAQVLSPYYIYISAAYPGLSVTGTSAFYELEVWAVPSVTKISAILQLQKRNSNGTYSNYGTAWSATANASTLFTSGTKVVVSGQVYRLKAVITANAGSGSESITVYSA